MPLSLANSAVASCSFCLALAAAVLDPCCSCNHHTRTDVVVPVGRPDFQAVALAKFAAGLAADPCGALLLWTGESHPCGDASNNNKAWPGVTCDAPTGFVTSIQLRGKGLKGPLPDSLSLLKTLRTVDLSNNSFEGGLPSSWSNLTSLEACDLSNNKLTGSLPTTYSSWSAMQHLDMHRNTLTGPLPATWASMNLLEVRLSRAVKILAQPPAHACHMAHLANSRR